MAALLEGQDDALLLGRGQACKDIVVFRKNAEVFLAHANQMVARDDLVDFQAHVFANLFCDERVVAGEDFCNDSVLFERGDRLRCGFFGRVEERDVAEEDQLVFVRHGEDLLRLRELPVGDAEDPVPVSAQVLIFFQEIVFDQVDHDVDLVVDLIVGAGFVDVFDGTFADQHVVAFVVDYDRHALALKVEGNLINLPAVRVHIQIAVREDRAVEQVAQPGLVVAVHVGVAEDVLALAVRHVHMLFKDDPVLGERAGFIRA